MIFRFLYVFLGDFFMFNDVYKSNLGFVKNFINDEEQKFNHILKEGAFTRNSEMNFKDFITFMINKNGLTTTLELDKYFKKVKGVWKLPVSKQNYSNRRQYIDPEYFKVMNAEMLKSHYEINKNSLYKFKNKKVYAIDGSTVDLPNCKEMREEFPMPMKGLEKQKSPKARISILSDVLNGYIIDSQIGPTIHGEGKLAWKHIEETSQKIGLNDTIIIFDRLYFSMKLVLHLLNNNADFIFRLRKTLLTEQIKKMKTNDEYVKIKIKGNHLKNIGDKKLKAKAKKMEEITLRIVKVPLSTGEIETLATTLSPEEATPEDLKELYGDRWEIEKDYDLLKNKLQIEEFSGKKRICIEQDFYSQIVAFNIINEEKIVQERKLKKNKKNVPAEKLKINNNHIVGLIKENLLDLIFAETEKEQDEILDRITYTIQRSFIKTSDKIDNERKTEVNINKHKITQRRNH